MRKFIIIAILCLLAPLTLLAQSHLLNYHLERADDFYYQNKFDDAIHHYLKALEHAEENQTAIIQQIALAYDKNNQPEQALTWYKKIFEIDKRNPENAWKYAKAILNTADYELAKKYFLIHTKLIKDSKGNKYAAICDSAIKWTKDPSPEFEVKQVVNWNTPHREFSPVPFRQGIIFTSSRDNKEESILDLYYQPIDLNVEMAGQSSPTRFEELFSPKHHEGPATFTKDGSKVFFTRTIEGVKVGDKHINHLNVFTSEFVNGSWTSPTNYFPFNHYSYSSGHPSIMSNGKAIFFMSDMPGGFGGTDIYVSFYDGNKWSDPSNLGSRINTSANELFPFIAESGKLYFASDGHPGMGNLDIFSSELNRESGEWSIPANLKSPINSNYDDFALSIFQDESTGFFSSNRPGLGDDDLYAFSKQGIITVKMNENEIAVKEGAFFDNVSYTSTLDSVPVETQQREGFRVLNAEKEKSYNWEGKKEGLHYTSVNTMQNWATESSVYEALIIPENKPVSVTASVRNSITDSTLKDTTVFVFRYDIPVDSIVTNDEGKFTYLVPLDAPLKFVVFSEEGKKKFESTKYVWLNLSIRDSIKPLEDVTLESYQGEVLTSSKRLVNSSSYKTLLKENLPLKIRLNKEGYFGVDTLFTANTTSGDTINAVIQLNKRPLVELNGQVVVAGKEMPETTIQIVKDNEVVKTVKTDKQGKYNLSLYKDENYDFVITKEGFFQLDTTVNTGPRALADNPVKLEVEEIKKDAEIRLDNIYFNFNQYTLSPKASQALENLAEFLKTNSNIKIELSSHTDTRGDENYNLKLSQKRAEEVKKSLFSKGIDTTRILAVGYGETMPIIKNAQTEDEHEKNRRTQFKVTDILEKAKVAEKPKEYLVFLMTEHKILAKNHPVFLKFKNINTELVEGKIKYFAGPYSSIAEAEKGKQDLIISGFKTAYIVTREKSKE